MLGEIMAEEVLQKQSSRMPLVLSIFSVVVSLAAYHRAYEEPDARVSHNVLSRVLEDVSRASVRNHDEFYALRNYVNGFGEGLKLCQATKEEESDSGENDEPDEDLIYAPDLASHDPIQACLRPKFWNRVEIDREVRLSNP